MARRANYGFEKRQKEIQRQKKKDEKAEKKRMKKEAAAAGAPEMADGQGDGDLEPPGFESGDEVDGEERADRG